MSHTVEETIENLKEENLELKLNAIKKELATFKVDMHRHLDLVITTNKDQLDKIEKNTEKTNGSVARAMERINALEREENKKKIEELKDKLEAQEKKTKFWTILSSNKVFAIMALVTLYLLPIALLVKGPLKDLLMKML